MATDPLEAVETGLKPEEDNPGAPETPRQESRDERVPELLAQLREQEARIQELESELGQVRRALEESRSQAEAFRAELALALEKYRQVLLASAQEVPEELVRGETVAALEEAFNVARAMVERVRRQMEAKMEHGRMPVGSPTRRPVDLSALPARDKIILGLRRTAGS